MAYTLTQARKLLTSAELAVFESSRTDALRELTAARLRSKVTRTRALRDKYRDLYRRQTVGMRGAPSRQRSPVGVDNQRTQHKSELFAEVLTRFEERLQKVQKAEAVAAERKAAAKAPAKKAAAKKVAPAKTAAKKAAPKKSAATKAPAGKAAPKKVPLKRAVAKALQRKTAAADGGAPAVERSAKAPASQRATRKAGPKSAPLDVTPATKRANPLRQRADLQTIHAHDRSRGRRVQGKRDAR